MPLRARNDDMVLPLVGLGMTVAGALQSAMPGVTMAGWLVGLLLSLPVGHAIGRRRAIAWQDDGRLWIDGGWFALAFALAIFVVRYALGVTFGVWPELGRQLLWVTIAGLAGGVIAGTGLGWLSGLLGISLGAGWIASIITATIGAVILLFVVRLLKRA